MAKSCGCTAAETSAGRSVINDSCPNVSGSICLMARQVFDCVKDPLDASACTVTVISPESAPTALLAARSVSQSAALYDVSSENYDREFRLCSADAVFPGTCSYTGADNQTHTGTCTISMPYEALMKYPDASVIKPELFAIGSCEIIKSALLEGNTFRCLCDGALVVSLCSYVPCFVPLTAYTCPVNSGCRQAQEQREVQSLFPSE